MPTIIIHQPETLTDNLVYGLTGYWMLHTTYLWLYGPCFMAEGRQPFQDRIWGNIMESMSSLL